MLADLLGSEIVSVVVTRPLDGPFSYLAPKALLPGQFVTVPFGNQKLTGVVWRDQAAPIIASHKIKPVEDILETEPLPESLIKLIDQLAKETLTPRGSLLRLAMSVPAALGPGPLRKMLVWRQPENAADLPSEYIRLVETLGPEGSMASAKLKKLLGIKTSSIKRLMSLGLIGEELRDLDMIRLEQRPRFRRLVLSAEQSHAVDQIQAHFSEKYASPVLLEGVPGSGKTEVYFEVMARKLKDGGTVLVLLPEIALSGQWLKRFEEFFGFRPALWHSGCTAAQRRKTWKDARRGDIRVLVGTRSALFLPFQSVGLVIMDEEHETSYKQEDGAIYDARHAARIRTRLESSSLLFASATPSLETIVRAEREQGLHIRLSQRHGTAQRPKIELADLRGRERRQGFLAEQLIGALEANRQAKQQSMLFLNKRGFAPLMTCRSCGYRFECGNCTAWLTLHQYRGRLLCHHCGFSRPNPDHCPECGTVDCTVAVGPGVERLEAEVKRLLPEIRTAIVTSDTITSSGKAEAFAAAMEGGEIDIAIGTQLVAKGHDFKNLTLVGIVDADSALGAGDPRANERCFQLLYQLAGRSGRADRRGRVIIQTRHPDHPVIRALSENDRSGFLAVERDERRFANLPPFGKLAAFILSGRNQSDVRHSGQKLVRKAPPLEGLRVLGPAPAPLSMLRGSYRERILIKASLDLDVPEVIRKWLSSVKIMSSVRLAIDIDPQSFY